MTSVDGMNVARYGATPIQRVIGVALLVMGLVLVPSLPGFAETGWWLLAFGLAAIAFGWWVGVRAIAGYVGVTPEHVVCMGDLVTHRIPLQDVVAVEVGPDGGRWTYVPVLQLTLERTLPLSPQRYFARWRCEGAAEAISESITRRR